MPFLNKEPHLNKILPYKGGKMGADFFSIQTPVEEEAKIFLQNWLARVHVYILFKNQTCIWVMWES